MIEIRTYVRRYVNAIGDLGRTCPLKKFEKSHHLDLDLISLISLSVFVVPLQQKKSRITMLISSYKIILAAPNLATAKGAVFTDSA